MDAAAQASPKPVMSFINGDISYSGERQLWGVDVQGGSTSSSLTGVFADILQRLLNAACQSTFMAVPPVNDPFPAPAQTASCTTGSR